MASSFARHLLWAALLLPAGLAAQGPAVPPGLDSAVAQAIGARWGVPAGQVRLAWGAVPAGVALAAGEPFQLAGRGLQGWFAAVLRPARPDAVALRVRAGVMRTVPVAARDLSAPGRLAASDLRREARVLWGAPASGDLEVAPGWEIRRPIAAGEVLAPPAVAPPALVVAGQPITLRWRRGAVEVTLPGTALHAAREGETARATVAGRPGRLEGRVTGPGTITLGGGGT
jgi:flagella basal body P-ring formation protein FlgA